MLPLQHRLLCQFEECRGFGQFPLWHTTESELGLRKHIPKPTTITVLYNQQAS